MMWQGPGPGPMTDVDPMLFGILLALIGLLTGGLFCYWAIRAFMTGFREGFKRKLREAEEE